MQDRRLVIDANILIRAVLGVRVRELIECYCESVAFYVAESNLEEAMRYLADLAPRRGISDDIWQAALASIMTAIQIIPQVELAAVEGEAIARIGQRDPEDWPAVGKRFAPKSRHRITVEQQEGLTVETTSDRRKGGVREGGRRPVNAP